MDRSLPALALPPAQVALRGGGGGAHRGGGGPHRGLADPGRPRERRAAGGRPRARDRLLLRQPPLPPPHRRPRAHRDPAPARGAPQRAAVQLRERGDPRAEDAGRVAQAVPRHPGVPRRGAGEAGGLLPDHAPGHRAAQLHHQQRPQRRDVHGPAGGRSPAARPGPGRPPRDRAHRHPPPAPGGGDSLRGAGRPVGGRRPPGARDGRPEPARQRGQVLEGPGRDRGRGVGRRRRPGPREGARPRHRDEPRRTCPSSSPASTASAPRCGGAAPAPGSGSSSCAPS